MGIFTDDGTVAAKAVTIASQQAGKRYVWGAGGPDNFDCSGLVHYCYALAGLPGAGNATSHQWSTYTIAVMGDPVAPGSEMPGDLVLPTPGHVGIAIGSNQMWNAPDVGIPVRIDKYSNVYRIRRLATPSNGSSSGATQASDPLGAVGDIFNAFKSTVVWLSDGHNWVRILEVAAGMGLLVLAVKM